VRGIATLLALTLATCAFACKYSGKGLEPIQLSIAVVKCCEVLMLATIVASYRLSVRRQAGFWLPAYLLGLATISGLMLSTVYSGDCGSMAESLALLSTLFGFAAVNAQYFIYRRKTLRDSSFNRSKCHPAK